MSWLEYHLGRIRAMACQAAPRWDMLYAEITAMKETINNIQESDPWTVATPIEADKRLRSIAEILKRKGVCTFGDLMRMNLDEKTRDLGDDVQSLVFIVASDVINRATGVSSGDAQIHQSDDVFPGLE